MGVMSLRNWFPLFQASEPKILPPIELSGPFLPEEEALKYFHEYQEILNRTWFHFNLTISRDLIITSSDLDFVVRDDVRLEAGIMHHQHQIKLFVEDPIHPEPLAIDHYILLNQDDAKKVQIYFEEQPLKPQELKSIIYH